MANAWPQKDASHRPRRPASNPVAHFQTHLDGLATTGVYVQDPVFCNERAA